MRSFFLALLFSTTIASAAEQPITFRVRFGMKDKDGADWSGKLTLSEGTVQSIRGWRWVAGDKAEGNAWPIATRRAPAQARAERQRVAAGMKLPVQDNGFIVTIDGAKPQ